MTNIVKRLRRDATCTSHHEAADEIEELRAALRVCVKAHEIGTHDAACTAYEVARAALGRRAPD